MSFIETKDKTKLFYKDWGTGKSIVFIHGWTVGSDSWEYAMIDLANRNYRAVAFDQRGCGRSDQPWNGYDYDTLADDLAALLEHLDLREATLVGHSMGCGVITRYLTKYGAERVARNVFVATTTPFLLKTEDNPDGIDKSVFDETIQALIKDRPQYINNLAAPFFGIGLPDISVSPEMMQWAVNSCLQASMRAAIETIRTNSETDMRKELTNITVPTLLIHGDGDVNTPLEITSAKTARLMPNSRLEIYKGLTHGLYITHAERLNDDILAFMEDANRYVVSS